MLLAKIMPGAKPRAFVSLSSLCLLFQADEDQRVVLVEHQECPAVVEAGFILPVEMLFVHLCDAVKVRSVLKVGDKVRAESPYKESCHYTFKKVHRDERQYSH